MTANAYGAVITGADVEAAVEATLVLWVPAYTYEVGRQKSVTLPPILAYGQSLMSLPGGTDPEELPVIVTTSPGITGPPTVRGSGQVDATWAVGVGVVVAGQTVEAAERTAKIYGAAIRMLLVQKGSLGGFATATTWIDEETAPLAYDLAEGVAACSLMFEVAVSAVVNRWSGPAVVPPDPTVAQTVGTVASVHEALARLT